METKKKSWLLARLIVGAASDPSRAASRSTTVTYVPSGRSALVAAEAEDRDMAKCDRMPISWHSISSGVIDIHV